jgi:hypothetical protein
MRCSVLCLGVLVALTLTASAGASQRYPVMGCIKPGTDYALERYAPAKCMLVHHRENYALLDIDQLSSIRWTHWGSRTAMGRGKVTVYGGPPITQAATVQAFGLKPLTYAANCTERGDEYTKLRLHVGKYSSSFNVAITQQC